MTDEASAAHADRAKHLDKTLRALLVVREHERFRDDVSAALERAFQPTLQAAYQSQKALPLPFSFGYNFSDQRDERAMIMVGQKQPNAAGLVKVANAGAPRLAKGRPLHPVGH